MLSSLPVLMLPTDLGTLAPLLSRTVVSACFVGGVLTLAAMCRHLWLEQRTEEWGKGPADWLLAAKRLLVWRPIRALSPSETLTRWLAIPLVAHAALAAVIWLFAPAGYADTAWQHTWDFIKGRSDDDSWGPMANALYYLEQEYYPLAGSKPLYSALVFDIGDKYQYPPFALFIAAALRNADVALAPFLSSAAVVSWIAVALTAVAVAGILEISLRRVFPEARGDHLLPVRILLAVALTLTYYPVVKAFTLGQIQAWLNAGVAVAMLAWLQGRTATTGIVVGLCALIKPHYAILLAWGAVRGEWRLAVSGAVVSMVGMALGVLVIGWEHHVDYLKLLAHLSQHGEAFYPNHSINGLLNRLMSLSDPVNFNNLSWSEGSFPPYTWWVHAGSVAAASLILGAVLFSKRPRTETARDIDLCIAVLSCTIASPIAWEHHYGVLTPIFALIAPIVLVEQRALAWIFGAFMLSGQYIPLTKLLAATPLNFFQSYLLIAAAVVLLWLYRFRRLYA